MDAAMNAVGLSPPGLSVASSSFGFTSPRRYRRSANEIRKATPTMTATNSTAPPSQRGHESGIAEVVVMRCSHSSYRTESSDWYQASAERQFVVPALAPQQHEQQTQHAAEQRPNQDCQQRALQAQERADHGHHLDVAQPHTFAATQPEIALGHHPEKAAAGGCAQQRIGKRKRRVGRRKIKKTVGQPGRCAIHGARKETQNETDAEAGEVQVVR